LTNDQCTLTCKAKSAKWNRIDNGEDADVNEDTFGTDLADTEIAKSLKEITAIAVDLKCKENNVVSHHKWRFPYHGFTDSFGGKRIIHTSDVGGYPLAVQVLTD